MAEKEARRVLREALKRMFERRMLKPTTAQTHAANLELLCRHCAIPANTPDDLHEYTAAHFDDVLGRLKRNKDLANATKRGMVFALRVFYGFYSAPQTFNQRLDAEARAYSVDYMDNQEDKGKRTAAEEKTKVDWLEVLRVAGSLKAGTPEHMLLSLLTLFPPRRPSSTGRSSAKPRPRFRTSAR